MNEGQCSIRDDMDQVYDKLLNANGLILGGPTYFYDLNGLTKNFIDRTMAIFYRSIGPAFNPEMPWLGDRPHAGKPVVIITTVAGSGHQRTIETLKYALDDCSKMKIVAQLAEVVARNDVDGMPEVLQRAEEAGKALGAALKAESIS